MKSEYILSPAEIAKIAPAALAAACRQARREARAYGTKFWVMKKGKVVGLKP